MGTQKHGLNIPLNYDYYERKFFNLIHYKNKSIQRCRSI